MFPIILWSSFVRHLESTQHNNNNSLCNLLKPLVPPRHNNELILRDAYYNSTTANYLLYIGFLFPNKIVAIYTLLVKFNSKIKLSACIAWTSNYNTKVVICFNVWPILQILKSKIFGQLCLFWINKSLKIKYKNFSSAIYITMLFNIII